MTDLSQNIRKKYDQLTKTQKRIAEYLLQHSDQLAFTTLDELSLQIGVSTTSVLRFARAIGFHGYVDMQQSLQNNIIKKASLPERFNDAIHGTKQDQLVIDVFQNDINNIYATLSALSEEALAEAVSSIISAKNIYVLGARGSFSVAHYLVHRLSQIKKNVRLVDGIGLMYPEQLSSIQPDDICISFMLPRYAKTTANLLSWLKRHGIRIILFTKLDNNEVDSYGDIILPCAITGASYKNSLIALFCICNYFLAAVAVENQTESGDNIARTEELLTGFYLGSS